MSGPGRGETRGGGAQIDSSLFRPGPGGAAARGGNRANGRGHGPTGAGLATRRPTRRLAIAPRAP
eukprot:6642277-Lingulodinium_polyedra.AAC.1